MPHEGKPWACSSYAQAELLSSGTDSDRYKQLYDEIKCTNEDRPPFLSMSPLVNQSFFGTPLIDPYSVGLPTPQTTTLLHYDLFTNAVTALERNDSQDALSLVQSGVRQLGILQTAVSSDGYGIQLVQANALTLAGQLEDAFVSLQSLAASAPKDQSKDITETVAALQVMLCQKYYELGLADQKKSDWAASVVDFTTADAYYPHPGNQLGLGNAHLQLDPGEANESVLNNVPTQLEMSSTAFKTYIQRSPDAKDVPAVQQIIDSIGKEIAIRKSGQRIQEGIAILEAAALLHVANDLQKKMSQINAFSSHNFWISDGTSWGGTGSVPESGDPLPFGSMPGVEPPSFPQDISVPTPGSGGVASDGGMTVLDVVTQQEVVPIPVMPSWPTISVTGGVGKLRSSKLVWPRNNANYEPRTAGSWVFSYRCR